MSSPHDIAPLVWRTLQQAPQVALRSPVAEATLQSAQNTFGHVWPDDLLDAYRHHNGQTPEGKPLFQDDYRWLSVQEALQEWLVWQDTMARPDMAEMRQTHESCGAPNAQVRMDWWNERWWPLAISDNADLLCMDGHPGPSGTLHQIIEVSSAHESRSRAAISIAVLFNNAAADLAGDLSDQD